ncbi:MAG: hypothetical protein ACREQ4_00840 [Candidatus Binataceae bacterium]
MTRFALAAIALMLMAGAVGCALGAVPMALSAAEAVGGGAINLAAAEADHHGKATRGDDPDKGMCNGLLLQTPLVIQFRPAAGGSLEWRELALGGSPDKPLWAPATEEHGTHSQWAAATNIAKMDFQPPLEGMLDPEAPNYIAYAPVENGGAQQDEALITLVVDFGPAVGTFSWNGRIYQYSVVHQLPCYPAPD